MACPLDPYEVCCIERMVCPVHQSGVRTYLVQCVYQNECQFDLRQVSETAGEELC